MTAPTLTTDRLTLRPLRLSDFDLFLTVLTDPERMRYMGGVTTEKQAWQAFGFEAGLWMHSGLGKLTAEAEDGTPVAHVGFLRRRDPRFPEDELGFFAYPGHEGRGYVTEAVIALRDWGFETRGLPTFVSYIDPMNHRSVAVATRAGATLDPDAPRDHPTTDVYRYARAA